MSEAIGRAAIYNAVSGVSNIGKVYDYERFVNDWSRFLDLFKTTIGSTPQIRGWMVGYAGAETVREFQCKIRRHRFVVRGFLRLDDSAASEKTAATLAESVTNALDADSTVHAHSFTTEAQLEIFESRDFGGVLCHYAEITQEYVEQV